MKTRILYSSLIMKLGIVLNAKKKDLYGIPHMEVRKIEDSMII